MNHEFDKPYKAVTPADKHAGDWETHTTTIKVSGLLSSDTRMKKMM